MEYLKNRLKTAGSWRKNDLSYYESLSACRIKEALSQSDYDSLQSIFNLIEIKDSTLGSEIERRYAALEGKSFNHSLDKRYESSIEEIVAASLDATLYGFGVCEIYLNEQIDFRVKRISFEYLFFDGEKIYLKTEKAKEIEVKAPKFIVFRKKPLLSKLLWIVYAKHFVLSQYIKYTELLGTPPLIVNTDSSSKDSIEAISDALRELKSGSYGVFGKDDTIKILEGKSGSQGDFLEFINYCDKEILKLINGSTLTSNDSKNGSLALARAHQDSTHQIISKDAKYASRCVNDIFSLLDMSAECQILIEKDRDLLERAQMLEIISSNTDYKMSAKDAADEFDLPPPKIEDAKAIKIEDNSKEVDNIELKDKFDEALEDKSFKEDLKVVENEIKESLEVILKDTNSYEDAINILSQKYEDININTLEIILERALSNSLMLGGSQIE